MREARYQLFFLFAVLFLGLILSSPARSETVQKGTEKAEQKPIVIKSDTLEVNNVLKVITFTGDVNAKEDGFYINCEKMLASYENVPTQKETGEIATRINKIVAIGRVKINRDQGGMATAEKAVYYRQDEKVVLTGKPVVKQGNDFIAGDRITIFLNENRSVVESSEDKKVRAVIFPKREKR
jgi:lipopolysaccharide export system protein LptA